MDIDDRPTGVAKPNSRNRVGAFRAVMSVVLSAITALVLAAGLTALTAPAAHAAGQFDNAAIADRALAVRVGSNGGECWIFVQDMILRAGGPNISTQAGGNDYFAHLRNAGGTQIGDVNALSKGDVVQQGRYGGHTYIIVRRVGGNTFDVVDSNHAYDRRVSRYHRTVVLNADTQGFRLGRVGATPTGRQPFGHLDQVNPAPGGVNVAGWAIDPDTDAPIQVHFYAGDGAAKPTNPGLALTANGSRPDVAKAHPSYSANHGVSGHFKLPAGNHTVCAYGIDTAGGHNPQLGCKPVTVAAPTPSTTELTPMPAAQGAKARSIHGNVPTSVKFVNSTSRTVNVYWISYAGARVKYTSLRPDQAYVQQTYLTHPWVIVDDSGRDRAFYLPAPAPSRAVIRD